MCISAHVVGRTKFSIKDGTSTKMVITGTTFVLRLWVYIEKFPQEMYFMCAFSQNSLPSKMRSKRGRYQNGTRSY